MFELPFSCAGIVLVRICIQGLCQFCSFFFVQCLSLLVRLVVTYAVAKMLETCYEILAQIDFEHSSYIQFNGIAVICRMLPIKNGQNGWIYMKFVCFENNVKHICGQCIWINIFVVYRLFNRYTERKRFVSWMKSDIVLMDLNFFYIIGLIFVFSTGCLIYTLNEKALYH